MPNSVVSCNNPSIDTALSEWRQGDFTLDSDLPFCHLADLNFPLSTETQEFAEQATTQGDSLSIDAVYAVVRGLVVLTQTCDLVRSCNERPYIDVAPLVEVTAEELTNIKAWKKPRYAHISGAEKHNLVADLDRIATLEKTIVAGWTREQGCLTDQDTRNFASQLTRKWTRFAFPDDFVKIFSSVKDKIQRRCGKQSPLGIELDKLMEMRVKAAPSWGADNVTLSFWFVQESPSPASFDWNTELLGDFYSTFPAERFCIDHCTVINADSMSVKDYLESDRFDFDSLSHRL